MQGGIERATHAMPIIVLRASSMKKPSHMVNCVRCKPWPMGVKRGCAQTKMKEKYANETIYYPCLTKVQTCKCREGCDVVWCGVVYVDGSVGIVSGKALLSSARIGYLQGFVGLSANKYTKTRAGALTHLLRDLQLRLARLESTHNITQHLALSTHLIAMDLDDCERQRYVLFQKVLTDCRGYKLNRVFLRKLVSRKQ
jgi:hypothetical protein